jgi:DNA polymerase (family 10)
MNEAVAEGFLEMADLLELQGADPYRIRAYQRAANAIASYHRDVSHMSMEELTSIPGVGQAIAAKVREFVETGRMHALEELREQFPAGLRELLRVPGLGPKKAMLLYRELGITSIPELLDAIAARKLRGIRGLGAKTEENLLRGIQTLQEGEGRIPLALAVSIAEELVSALKGIPGVVNAEAAGSLRRMKETVGDIDILVATEEPGRVGRAVETIPLVAEVAARGETKITVRTTRGLQVDLRLVAPSAWGSALQYFTGSKPHNVKVREHAVKLGLKLSEYGVFRQDTGDKLASATEEEVYAALGLPWIPPTLREDRGEVEAALGGRLPRVVVEEEILADLHTHTNRSDGLVPLASMVEAAVEKGYRYYGVTDHGPRLYMTGLKPEDLREQRREIAQLAEAVGLPILQGSELNIGPEGELDYPEEVLRELDFTVASVHSHFNMDREAMTRRLVRAMENPYVNIIGHPTTRIIGKRQPLDFDLEEVLRAAARTGTAMEINAFPDRLDLSDEDARLAVEAGCYISINTDAHAPAHLWLMRYGVATAQRGWVEGEAVVNTWPLEKFLDFVRSKRRG